jgi:hypothetical protein
MITAHARPKPTNASVWTFIIAVLSAPEQRDRIERLLAAFMGDQNQLFQLQRVPSSSGSFAKSSASLSRFVHRHVDAKPRRTICHRYGAVRPEADLIRAGPARIDASVGDCARGLRACGG